jgi:hypothetical protein
MNNSASMPGYIHKSAKITEQSVPLPLSLKLACRLFFNEGWLAGLFLSGPIFKPTRWL